MSRTPSFLQGDFWCLFGMQLIYQAFPCTKYCLWYRFGFCCLVIYLRTCQDQERISEGCSNLDFLQPHGREDNRQVSWGPFADRLRAVCMIWSSRWSQFFGRGCGRSNKLQRTEQTQYPQEQVVPSICKRAHSGQTQKRGLSLTGVRSSNRTDVHKRAE